MKKTIALAACGSWLLLGSVLFAAPQLGIEQAAKMAQEQLRSRGLEGQHRVTSLALERASLTNGAYHWVAQFTPSIPNGDRQETGVEIEMDGTVTHLVTQSAKERAKERPKFGARNMR